MIKYYLVEVETCTDFTVNKKLKDRDQFAIPSDRKLSSYLKELWELNKENKCHIYGSNHIDHSKKGLPRCGKVFKKDVFKRLHDSGGTTILSRQKTGAVYITIKEVQIREREDRKPKYQIGDKWICKRHGCEVTIDWRQKSLVFVSVKFPGGGGVHMHKYSVSSALNWAKNEAKKVSYRKR